MARSLTPQDAHAFVNLMVKELTAQNDTIQAVDSSSFASVGDFILANSMDNIYNALSRVIGRTYISVRPYDAKFRTINAIDSGMLSERMRKISFYSKDAQASGWFNTNSYIQHAAGLDNGVNRVVNGSILPMGGLGNMWEQNPAVPLELNFAGHDTWDDSQTIYENQVKDAFNSEENFMSFMSGFMTEKGNDIESQKEAFNRACVLQSIGMAVNLNQKGTLINLKAGFNTKFGTNYTSAQLLSTYLKDFLAYYVSVIKTLSSQMAIRSAKFHWSPAKTVNGQRYTLLRHTPKNRQRAFIYQPLLNDAEAQVFSQVFNPQYLDVGQYEGVDFWQNMNNPSAIDITPAIPNLTTPSNGQKRGSRVQLDNVVGVLFDEDAMMIDYQLDSAYATGVEARKGYHNLWYHFSYNMITDPTENIIVFYLGNDS